FHMAQQLTGSAKIHLLALGDIGDSISGALALSAPPAPFGRPHVKSVTAPAEGARPRPLAATGTGHAAQLGIAGHEGEQVNRSLKAVSVNHELVHGWVSGGFGVLGIGPNTPPK